MENVDPDTMQDFIIWLHRHEQDIHLSINDFGDLKDIFKALFGRDAGAIVDDDFCF